MGFEQGSVGGLFFALILVGLGLLWTIFTGGGRDSVPGFLVFLVGCALTYLPAVIIFAAVL